MKEITTVWIQNNKEAYKSDVKNSIYEEEYAKKYISDIAFDKEKAKLQPFEFSVDISTMEAVAQGNAGRCWIVAGLNLLREHIVKGLRKSTPQSANFQVARRIFSLIHLKMKSKRNNTLPKLSIMIL